MPFHPTSMIQPPKAANGSLPPPPKVKQQRTLNFSDATKVTFPVIFDSSQSEFPDGVHTIEVDNNSSLVITVKADGQPIRTLGNYSQRWLFNVSTGWNRIEITASGTATAGDTLAFTMFNAAVTSGGAQGSSVAIRGKNLLPGDTAIGATSTGDLNTQIALIAGQSPQMDNGNVLGVSIRGSATNPGDTPLPTGNASSASLTSPALAVQPSLANGLSVYPQASASALADTNLGNIIPASQMVLYNESTYDRARGNTSVVLLASAARTAGAQSAVQTNYNARGILVLLDISAASGTGGLTMSVIMPNPASGYGWTLAQTNGALTSVQRYGIMLYPSAAAPGASLVTGISNLAYASMILPRSWIIGVAVGDASSYTYSVSAFLII